MSLNGNCTGEGAVGEDFYKLTTVDETCCDQFLYTYLLEVLGLSESSDNVEVDCLVFNAVDILETPLRETALQRHLTTFETDFTLVAAARLGALVTAG